ncbi:AI-2E family transporter [bacterium]|nr:AI-2E family transporter [bacterium]
MINNSVFNYFTVKNVIFFLVLALLVVFAIQNPEVALIFFVSMVIACSLNPLVNRLNIKLKRPVAALIVLGTFILALCLFLMPIIIIGIYQILSLDANFDKFMENAEIFIANHHILQQFGISKAGIANSVMNLFTNADQYIDNMIAFIKNIGSGMVYVFITVIFTYFFMADTTSVKTTFLDLFPSNIRPRVEEIVDIIARKMGGYITAQFYAILSVGIVMTIGLLIFRVDYAILLGLLTAVLDLIPVAGPALALVICLIAAAGSGWVPIVGVIVSFIAAQLIENNFVRPYAFSKLLKIHPVMIFLFLYIAAKYLGVIGALFAPAMAAMVCVLVEELYIKNIE